MQVFYVRAEPLAASSPSAVAMVVAESARQALLLLRKDIAFSGYRLPPAEMTPYEVAPETVRCMLGDAAAHEIGVYGFTVLESSDIGDPQASPAAAS